MRRTSVRRKRATPSFLACNGGLRMASLTTLDQCLRTIPPARRASLDRKVEDRKILTKVARTIPNWRVAASFFPGVGKPDVEAILHDNMLSLEQEKVGLIDKWVERNGYKATYRALAKCLFDADALDSVDALCREFGASSAPTEVPGPTLPPPTPKELMNNVQTVRTYELGIQLDLEDPDMERVMEDHKNDSRRQLTKVFSLYLEQNVDASWLHVATALYAIGEKKCAADIERKFGVCVPSAASSPTPTQPVVPGFKKTVKRGERVTLTDLQRFPTPVGTINILQRVGPDYKPLLGNILLKDHNGQRIRGIEMTNSNNVDLVVYDMFQKWCTEDEECTWRALVLHLNEANLRSLASDIESALI